MDHIRASAEPPAPAWNVIPFSVPEDARKSPSVQRTIRPDWRVVSRVALAVEPENPVPTLAGGGSGVSPMALSVRLHLKRGGPQGPGFEPAVPRLTITIAARGASISSSSPMVESGCQPLARLRQCSVHGAHQVCSQYDHSDMLVLVRGSRDGFVE